MHRGFNYRKGRKYFRSEFNELVLIAVSGYNNYEYKKCRFEKFSFRKMTAKLILICSLKVFELNEKAKKYG